MPRWGLLSCVRSMGRAAALAEIVPTIEVILGADDILKMVVGQLMSIEMQTDGMGGGGSCCDDGARWKEKLRQFFKLASFPASTGTRLGIPMRPMFKTLRKPQQSRTFRYQRYIA